MGCYASSSWGFIYWWPVAAGWASGYHASCNVLVGGPQEDAQYMDSRILGRTGPPRRGWGPRRRITIQLAAWASGLGYRVRRGYENNRHVKRPTQVAGPAWL